MKKTMWFFMLLILPIALYAQKDVTQFLGIPVDGSKSEMIQKLKTKGYTISPYKKDVLVGEFNGIDVNIYIVTNNNKVCRIMVADANTLEETDIRIRFNTLLQQFQNNKKYLSLPDSTISKYIIPEGEDISYELSVKNKRYEAIFYQKTADYDSLEIEMSNLLKKETFNEEDKERLSVIMKKKVDESNFNKVVWFMISEHNGKYSISMYYDHQYNRANGEGL
ncbi:hypothetical protein E4635_09630 [Flavobacterium humi]|uniref:DUF4138 domain-containing protein n=1 Tax=Flavobacterium humi TaxID=2562683 RepID=A0A4Z0L7P1_9FLAO|nr:hypothetical protein E4635_09630 [Flavobacterium humi]